MADPETLEVYNRKYQANIRYTGQGLETAMVHPCPFCAAPDFMEVKILQTIPLMSAGATCRECGRGSKTIVTRGPNGLDMEIVQTAGAPLPSYLPAIRRVDQDRDTVSGEPPKTLEASVPTEEKLPDGQHKDHWVLPEASRQERVRPVRRSYKHVGPQGPRFELRDLTEAEIERYAGLNYAKFEVYPESESPKTGRYWTQAELDARGCGATTTMPQSIAETYASDPGFYGKTFCAGCKQYLPVGAPENRGEFIWDDGSGEYVGT